MHGSDEEDFSDNISLQYSCVFALIQVGEYVKRLSSELREDNPDVDWKYAAGMRDFVVHNYASVNISKLRMTVLKELPPFKDDCTAIISRLSKL